VNEPDNPKASYAISYEGSAAEELAKLDKPVARSIIKSVNKLSGDPRPPGCRALVGYDGLWRIRVGGYRVVYDATRIRPYRHAGQPNSPQLSKTWRR